MKVLLNTLKGILIGAWVVLALVTTLLLLSYNRYHVSEVGSKSIFVIDSDRLEPEYVKNDLIIAHKVSENKYKVGDAAFFYLDNPEDAIYINYGKITKIDEVDHGEDSYFFGNDSVSYSRLIGPASEVKIYHKWGLLLSILESKWGFMFFIIFPTIFAVVYEIYSIVEEVKTSKDNEED